MGVSYAKTFSTGMVDLWFKRGRADRGSRYIQLGGKTSSVRAPPKAANNLHANSTLLRNVKELCRLQATLPEVVADLVRAKKERWRPSEAEQQVKHAELMYYCDFWDSLQFIGDGLLTIMLATGANPQERKRVFCLFTLCRELIWETHKQAHTGAERVRRCLQL